MPVRYFRLLIFLVQLVAASMVAASPSIAADATDDDLGFVQDWREVRAGWLMRRVFSARDENASFIINDVPIYYNRPRGVSQFQVQSNERHLRSVLDSARATGADWHRLAILLEDGACFYRKLNRFGESLGLMRELVRLLEDKAPDSDDLCNARIGCAQAASATHEFHLAEHLYQQALESAQRMHGKDDQLVVEVRTHLFYLYYDLGRVDKAVATRRDVIRSAGYDAVADNDVASKYADQRTWDDINDQIDAAATTNELASAERDADAAAKRALKRDWSVDASDDWSKRYDEQHANDDDTKKKDGKDEPKPIPYRLPGSRGE